MEQQEQARALRLDGKSIKWIARHLNVAWSSVSGWTRNIHLTREQKAALLLFPATCGGKANRESWAQKREGFRQQGRNDAQQADLTHAMGCMLYWAEGRKDRSQLRFSNTDPYMMQFFVNFLRTHFTVSLDEIFLSVNCYTDMRTLKEIESYWLSLLSLPKESLRKSTINKKREKRGKEKSHKKYEYGVCQITVNRQDVLQRIYGAIQKYANAPTLVLGEP